MDQLNLIGLIKLQLLTIFNGKNYEEVIDGSN